MEVLTLLIHHSDSFLTSTISGSQRHHQKPQDMKKTHLTPAVLLKSLSDDNREKLERTFQ